MENGDAGPEMYRIHRTGQVRFRLQMDLLYCLLPHGHLSRDQISIGSRRRRDWTLNYDSDYLARHLAEQGIQGEILQLETGTPTVETAAQAVNVPVDHIVKSVLFLANQEPLLVIANGTTRIDRKLLANYLHISPKRVKIANPEQVLQLTGYPAGALPPFGHKRRFRTILATSLLSQQIIYAGGGSDTALMRLTVEELQRVVGAESAALLANPS